MFSKPDIFKINEPFKKKYAFSLQQIHKAQRIENIYLLSHAFLPGIIMINHAVYYWPSR